MRTKKNRIPDIAQVAPEVNARQDNELTLTPEGHHSAPTMVNRAKKNEVGLTMRVTRGGVQRG